MRLNQVVFVLTSATSILACAPAPQGPRPVNVAVVRHEIDAAIHGERKITSVGHVTNDRAVVYTAKDSNARAEETWIRAADGWKLEHAASLATSD